MQVKPWKQADGVVISTPESQNHSDDIHFNVLSPFLKHVYLSPVI